MKIAMVGQFPPHVGGVGVHIHTLSKRLVEMGHEVYVVTYPHKGQTGMEVTHGSLTESMSLAQRGSASRESGD